MLPCSRKCYMNGGDPCSLHGCKGRTRAHNVFYVDGKLYVRAALCTQGYDHWKSKGWILKIDPLDDGEFCTRCLRWYPQAEGNQTNGTLICYSCRTK